MKSTLFEVPAATGLPVSLAEGLLVETGDGLSGEELAAMVVGSVEANC